MCLRQGKRAGAVFGLACLLATGELAFADTENLTIYGQVNASFDRYYGAQGTANTLGLNRINSWGSRIGFRGEEDLDGGNKIIFKLENGFKTTSGGAGFCNRECWIGGAGRFGTFKVGRLLPIYDDVSLPWYQIRSPGSHNPNAVWANCSNAASAAGGCFNTFLTQAIRYDTVKVSGLSASLSVSRADGLPSNGTKDPKIIAVGAEYRDKLFYIGVAHERNADVRDDGLVDVATTVAGSVSRGDFYLGFGYERLTYQISTGGELKRDYVGFMPRYSAGAHTFWGNYGIAGSGKGSSAAGSSVNAVQKRENSGAEMWTLGYQYRFSKKTEAHFYYNKIQNQTYANYNFSTNPYPSLGIGRSVSSWAVGMEQRF